MPPVHKRRQVAPREFSRVPDPEMTLCAPKALKSEDRQTVERNCARKVCRERAGRLMRVTVCIHSL